MDEAEFKRICLDGGGLRPLSTFIERKRRAKTARDLADKHIRTARTLLHDGEEGHFVVHHAYFAMSTRRTSGLRYPGIRRRTTSARRWRSAGRFNGGIWPQLYPGPTKTG